MADPLPPTIDVFIEFDSSGAAQRNDVRTGLTSTPKWLPPKWLYDKRGSELFDEITRLDEYYVTRAERSILREHAPDMAALSGASTLVELGSGTTEKTQLLLRAFTDRGGFARFIPFDVSETVLRSTSQSIANAYPGLRVHGIVGDFDRHLGDIPTGGRRMVCFLGSTIGNLEPADRAAFLGTLAASLESGDTFLLGVDLVKDERRLWEAYNDAAGVTAEFNKNVLAVLNRELNAEFVLDNFEHAADWDAENHWIDIRLRSLVDQTVVVDDLDLRVEFEAGEELRTEVSTKFTKPLLEAELRDAGLSPAHWWTDEADDFAMSLSVRP